MRLSKRERKYMEFLFTRDLHGDRTPRPGSGIGPATILSCEAKKLVRLGANGYYPTALGRFVGEPLEWREEGTWLRTDYLGGDAWVSPTTEDVDRYVWRGVLRGQCLYTAAYTQDAARAACEAWVDAERLRQAGGDGA